MRYFFIIFILLGNQCFADVLYGHMRHRPPDLQINGTQFSGPLKDVIDVAAKNIGHSINWTKADFSDSLKALHSGKVDIVPLVTKLPDRLKSMRFIGPLGYSWVEVYFLLNVRDKLLIQNVTDLEKINIGALSGSYYTKNFKYNNNIKKKLANNELELLQLLHNEDVDAIIVLNKKTMDEFLQNPIYNNNFIYSSYMEKEKQDIFFAMPVSPKKKNIENALQKELERMLASNEVLTIYAQYDLYPPKRHENT